MSTPANGLTLALSSPLFLQSLQLSRKTRGPMWLIITWRMLRLTAPPSSSASYLLGALCWCLSSLLFCWSTLRRTTKKTPGRNETRRCWMRCGGNSPTWGQRAKQLPSSCGCGRRRSESESGCVSWRRQQKPRLKRRRQPLRRRHGERIWHCGEKRPRQERQRWRGRTRPRDSKRMEAFSRVLAPAPAAHRRLEAGLFSALSGLISARLLTLSVNRFARPERLCAPPPPLLRSVS